MAEHNTLTGASLHEPKGAATAAVGHIYVATGTGTGVWQVPATGLQMGWWDYNDAATAVTPIALTLADTYYPLTNDGAGPFTNLAYGLDGVTGIWNTVTNRFDFSGLALGATLDIRLDVTIVTAGANDNVTVGMHLAEGGTPYDLVILSEKGYKTAGSHHEILPLHLYIGDANTQLNGAYFEALCDGTGATVQVNGFFIRAITGG
tara:strand:- start:3110 stop:3724 length:615 start_codon:yes stop_codon:yes gene_type:complete